MSAKKDRDVTFIVAQVTGFTLALLDVGIESIYLAGSLPEATRRLRRTASKIRTLRMQREDIHEMKTIVPPKP